jgi:hypothetical protein
LAIFNGTDGNTINDTGIYHQFDEDNGGFLIDPSGTNYIGINTEDVSMQNEMNIVRVTSERVRIASDNGSVRITAQNGVQIYSDVEMDGYRITEVGEPTDLSDVTTKQYVDNITINRISSRWVELGPSDIQGLHVYPGKTLVDGITDNVIIVDSLEFYRGEQMSTYSAAGVNLYVNYEGNYVDPTQSYTWKIPADAVQAGGTGLLTSTGGSRGLSVNNASFQPFTVGQGVILMSDSAITGTGGNVSVKVSYRLSIVG